jgi:hypothetical protein
MAIMAIRSRFGVLSGENVGLCTIRSVSLQIPGNEDRPLLLTDWNLLAEIIPITPNIRLHHLAAQHVTIIAAVALKQSFLLSRNWCMISLIESLFD